MSLCKQIYQLILKKLHFKHNKKWREKMIGLFKDSIEVFLTFFIRLHKEVPPPKYIRKSGMLQIRYEQEDIQTLCLIKIGRIISSLNAILVLLKNGHIIEIAVLLRTIKECNSELNFLLENYPTDKLTSPQEQYIKEFFTEEFGDPSDPIKTSRQHNRVGAKKIHAGSAREFYNMSDFIKDPKLKAKIKKIANPSDTQEITQKILNVFSGYVHYGYSQSSELIGDSPPKYHLSGFLGTSKMNEWIDNLITEFDGLYNLFRFLCYKFDFQKEYIIITKKQFDFQKTTGL